MKSQIDGQYSAGQKGPVGEFEHYNYETLMRIESELYVLFRFLLKFLKNENFLEFYQHLLNLKKAMRTTIDTLFDFSVILTGNDRFADKNSHLQFYTKINNHLTSIYKNRKSTVGLMPSNTDEQSLLTNIQRGLYLDKEQIKKILVKGHCLDPTYLSMKLNKIRLNELKLKLQIKTLESELQLNKNCNIQIEKRLNKIEDLSITKFDHF